jgi:hypothetical protein
MIEVPWRHEFYINLNTFWKAYGEQLHFLLLGEWCRAAEKVPKPFLLVIHYCSEGKLRQFLERIDAQLWSKMLLA